MALLELKDITRTFVNDQVETKVLKGINLNVEKGEFVSIMGASGSGKSTLLNIIGCLDRATSGTYVVNDVLVDKLSENELADMRNREMGFVFQSFHLLKNLTARANVELPLIYRGMNGEERKTRAIKALERVGLGHRMDHYPKQMSGGEQQRVAIARSIVGEPSFMLADEPTGALDTKNTWNVMELFYELNKKEGITIVMVTHDTQVAHYADKIIWLVDGVIDRIEVVTEDKRNKVRAKAAMVIAEAKAKETADAGNDKEIEKKEISDQTKNKAEQTVAIKEKKEKKEKKWFFGKKKQSAAKPNEQTAENDSKSNDAVTDVTIEVKDNIEEANKNE